LQHTSAQYLDDQREAPGIGFPSIWRLEWMTIEFRAVKQRGAAVLLKCRADDEGQSRNGDHKA
jgi:hypothetical protein